MTKLEIRAACPACEHRTTFTEKEWRETFRREDIWDGRKKVYRTTPGPDAPLTCAYCKRESPAHEWHRLYEREHLAAAGWKTPRMMEGA